jgi:hypothetical protein
MIVKLTFETFAEAQQHSMTGDVARFNRLKYMIEHPESTNSMNPGAGVIYGGMTHSASPAAVAPSPIMNGAASGYNNVGLHAFRGNAKGRLLKPTNWVGLSF